MHRPIACRTQFNLDADELLCMLDPPQKPSLVPYMNTLPFNMALVRICGRDGSPLGDIREFFPQGQ
jgi:hypothetical protein